MDAPTEVQLTGEFKCQLCGLKALYMYCGPQPPNFTLCHCMSSLVDPISDNKPIRLLEEAYVMKDPFTHDKDKFIILGSHCSLGSRSVCVGIDCSLFYSKRFCLCCVKENLKASPLEIQEDMNKRKPQQKSSKKPQTKHKS